MTRFIPAALVIAGCISEVEMPDEESDVELTAAGPKQPRYQAIKDAAAAHGFEHGYLLAGIGNTETGLAMCWSEATWACKGPSAPACNGGPIIAGASDGACSIQEGGLGMFQFDAGTYQQTIAKYGPSILTYDGQIRAVIDYAVWMVKVSVYTTNAETDQKARAWLESFDPNNPTLRDQWIKTVLRYYNGCQPSWDCWAPRVKTYTDGYFAAIHEPGGLGFWTIGTSCNGSPSTVGAIDAKYRALGGCSSILGKPTTEERGTPDGRGRYSVFERGSIYWTAQTGAFEVHGAIRDKWAELGWEAGRLGYPISDEQTVAGGKRSDFEGGSITWSTQTNTATVTYR